MLYARAVNKLSALAMEKCKPQENLTVSNRDL